MTTQTPTIAEQVQAIARMSAETRHVFAVEQTALDAEGVTTT